MAVWDGGKGGCIPCACCKVAAGGWYIDPRRFGSGGCGGGRSWASEWEGSQIG